MLSQPAYITIPGVFISALIMLPIYLFYRRKQRQQYNVRSPLLTTNCLIFQLICFWTILISSIFNYDEESPTQMNITQWSCPNDNSVESLDRQVLANKLFIAIFTASKNSQILLFIARIFRIICAYNIEWEKHKNLTSFFVKQTNSLLIIYLLWVGVFFMVFFQPYLSPFSFWMIEIYHSDTTRNIFSCIFTSYFTFCVIILLYCLLKVDLIDSRYKIKYDIHLIVSCFIFTNLFFFATQEVPCSNSTDYYFLGINPFFWIVILLDLWVLLAIGYAAPFVDAKYENENYVLMHQTNIGNLQGFMYYKNKYDYKRIFFYFLDNLSEKELSYYKFSPQITEEHLKMASPIFFLFIDILSIDVKMNNQDSGFNLIQAQNNTNNGETQIQNNFQNIISEYFIPTQQNKYLGKLYGNSFSVIYFTFFLFSSYLSILISIDSIPYKNFYCF